MHFRKTLLLCPQRYSQFNSFEKTLKFISDEVVGFNVRNKINQKQLQFDTQIFRFPSTIRIKWEKYFLKKINELILSEFNATKPDLVFIYNSEYLLPETCEIIKKEARLIFFMGDSPFYTPVNNYYLSLLKYGDLVLAPDSFWLQQLNMMGIRNTALFFPSIDNDSYKVLDKNEIEKTIHETDILYVGACYVNSWGYKKAQLMSHFTNFNFELYGGKEWKRWFKYFPGLESKFTYSAYIDTERLNKMFNKTKLIPVDGNPALINGIHIRVFEALGSGALPLIEDRKDIRESIFSEFGKDLPVIYNYNQAAEIASYFLKNENERTELSRKMKDFINTKYSFKNNADYILSKLKEFKK